ncbi:hypothetical protein [Streptomyces echinatus]
MDRPTHLVGMVHQRGRIYPSSQAIRTAQRSAAWAGTLISRS